LTIQVKDIFYYVSPGSDPGQYPTGKMSMKKTLLEDTFTAERLRTIRCVRYGHRQYPLIWQPNICSVR